MKPIMLILSLDHCKPPSLPPCLSLPLSEASLCQSLCLCLSISLSLSLCFSISLSLSLSLPASLSLCLYQLLRLSVSVSLCLSTSLSLCVSLSPSLTHAHTILRRADKRTSLQAVYLGPAILSTTPLKIARHAGTSLEQTEQGERDTRGKRY